MESTWALNWDNNEVGWISAVNTRGTATARFRATGPMGEHRVKVYSGYMGQPYLNYQQAPTSYLPRPEFVFRTTPGGSVPAAYAEPYVTQPVPPSVAPPGANIGISPTQGPVGSQIQLRGHGFPANEALTLHWQTMIGSRVTDSGFAPDGKVLGQVLTADDGSFASR
jgi:hypothetical protein